MKPGKDAEDNDLIYGDAVKAGPENVFYSDLKLRVREIMELRKSEARLKMRYEETFRENVVLTGKIEKLSASLSSSEKSLAEARARNEILKKKFTDSSSRFIEEAGKVNKSIENIKKVFSEKLEKTHGLYENAREELNGSMKRRDELCDQNSIMNEYKSLAEKEISILRQEVAERARENSRLEKELSRLREPGGIPGEVNICSEEEPGSETAETARSQAEKNEDEASGTGPEKSLKTETDETGEQILQDENGRKED